LRGLPAEAFTLAKTLFSRVVKHGVSQQPIRFGLVTAAIGFEPCDDVRIQTHRNGLLRWSIELADSAPLQSTTAGASEKSMSLSLFAAIARMSRFCSFVSFLIGSPFVGLGGASRDDTNDFFVVFLIKSMNDQ